MPLTVASLTIRFIRLTLVSRSLVMTASGTAVVPAGSGSVAADATPPVSSVKARMDARRFMKRVPGIQWIGDAATEVRRARPRARDGHRGWHVASMHQECPIGRSTDGTGGERQLQRKARDKKESGRDTRIAAVQHSGVAPRVQARPSAVAH